VQSTVIVTSIRKAEISVESGGLTPPHPNNVASRGVAIETYADSIAEAGKGLARQLGPGQWVGDKGVSPGN
jgi:hypothetical protein